MVRRMHRGRRRVGPRLDGRNNEAPNDRIVSRRWRRERWMILVEAIIDEIDGRRLQVEVWYI